MIKLLLSLIFYHLSSSRKLLQTVIGPNGQDCTPPLDDNPPDACPITPNGFTSLTGPIIECEENYDCCTCESIICGISPSEPCDKFVANGDFSAFFVGPIIINGDSLDGAAIDCNGDSACEGTQITGTAIKEIKCGGDRSCLSAQWTLSCVEQAPCLVGCEGDLACTQASMTVNNVESVICGGDNACADGTMTINNPESNFALECGVAACQELTFTVNIPSTSSNTFLKGFNCADVNACLDAVFTLNNNSPNTVVIEEINCEGVFGCAGATFIFSGSWDIQECKCGGQGGCLGTRGLDACLGTDGTGGEVGEIEGLSRLECVGDLCIDKTMTIINPLNDFELICRDEASCNNFELTIVIDNDAQDYPIERIKGVTCEGTISCLGLHLNIINDQSGVNKLIVENIECIGEGSCAQAKFGGNGARNVVFKQIGCNGNCGERYGSSQCLVECRGSRLVFCGSRFFRW